MSINGGRPVTAKLGCSCSRRLVYALGCSELVQGGGGGTMAALLTMAVSKPKAKIVDLGESGMVHNV